MNGVRRDMWNGLAGSIPPRHTILRRRPSPQLRRRGTTGTRAGARLRNPPGAGVSLVRQGLHNVLDHLLRVGEKHHGLVHVEHVIVHTGITDPAH